MEDNNEAFKKKVLENPMFDDYDKRIIKAHLSNFYCVFQLGFEAGRGAEAHEHHWQKDEEDDG